MDTVDVGLVVFDVKVRSCLDVGGFGRVTFVVVVVVSCLGAIVVDCFILDVAVDSFVDAVDVSFI